MPVRLLAASQCQGRQRELSELPSAAESHQECTSSLQPSQQCCSSECMQSISSGCQILVDLSSSTVNTQLVSCVNITTISYVNTFTVTNHSMIHGPMSQSVCSLVKPIQVYIVWICASHLQRLLPAMLMTFNHYTEVFVNHNVLFLFLRYWHQFQSISLLLLFLLVGSLVVICMTLSDEAW